MNPLAYMKRAIGVPYVWGATGPKGYDCSGLVWAAYRSAGINLPRTTYDQIHSGTAVNLHQLKPGDLIFPSHEHVGVYLGNGRVISAPHTGARVHVTSLGAWIGSGTVARRIVPGGLPPAGVKVPQSRGASQARAASFAPDMIAASRAQLQATVQPPRITIPQPVSVTPQQVAANLSQQIAPTSPTPALSSSLPADSPPTIRTPNGLTIGEASGRLTAIRRGLLNV